MQGFSFSWPNGFAQRTIAVIRLARTSRLFLSESNAIHFVQYNNLMDEIYNFKDIYFKRTSREERRDIEREAKEKRNKPDLCKSDFTLRWDATDLHVQFLILGENYFLQSYQCQS